MKIISRYLKLIQVFIARKIFKYSKDTLLQMASANICNKINSFSIPEVYKRATRTKSRGAIDSFYNQKVTPKFINKLDTSKQYIFKTFEDFKNGDYRIASIRKFSDKKATYYYEKEKGETEYLMQDYAFCDKGFLFIKTRNNYSSAFINNNRIYALEPKTVILKSTSVPIEIPISGLSYPLYIGSIRWQDVDNRGLQNVMLDLQTGNTY